MKILVEIATVALVIPAAVAIGGFRFDLHAGDGTSIVATKTTTEPEALFENVGDGSYVMSVGRVNAAGEFIAPPVTQAVVVQGPATVEIQVPGGLTITVAE